MVFIIPDITVHGKYDRRCWINWSNYMLGNGLANIYRLEINYLPLYNYILFLYGKLMGTTEGIILHINSLKYITLFFELIGIAFVVALVRKQYARMETVLLLSLLIIFNPAFFYNSALYGQVDGIYSSFVFISVYYALRKDTKLSILFYVIALNFKLQAITYFPLVFLINLPQVHEFLNLRKAVNLLLPSIILQIVIILPFVFNGDAQLLWNVVVGSKGKYPFVSMGALNFWSYFFEEPRQVMDIKGFWGKSYHVYGLLLYNGFMLLTIFPLLYWKYRKMIRKEAIGVFPTEKILLTGILVSLVFFYFNTQMHSRYVHAAMIFGGAYALYTKKYLIYGLLSLAYFLNIEYSARILKGNISDYTQFFFEPVFVASVYGLVLILCFRKLYNGFFKQVPPGRR
ncbi:MAG: hypothetical protein LRY55_09980 [Leadbetterella sp.]|nr:hypothetical protein [Leadbetterella sp.]